MQTPFPNHPRASDARIMVNNGKWSAKGKQHGNQIQNKSIRNEVRKSRQESKARGRGEWQV